MHAHQYVSALLDYGGDARRTGVAAVAQRQLTLVPREAFETLPDGVVFDRSIDHLQVRQSKLQVHARVGALGTRPHERRAVDEHHVVPSPLLG